MKTIRILPAARHDLMDGFQFYEMQAEGIGRYFLDTLYSYIESLRVYVGVHPLSMGSYYRFGIKTLSVLGLPLPGRREYRVDIRRL